MTNKKIIILKEIISIIFWPAIGVTLARYLPDWAWLIGFSCGMFSMAIRWEWANKELQHDLDELIKIYNK